MRACGLTDHGNVSGLIDMLKACRKEEIKPILGMEAYLCRDMFCHDKDGQPDGRKGNRHVNIIAKNTTGLENLFTLSHKSFLEGYYYDPRIDWAALQENKEGLIITSACPNSLVNTHLSRGNYESAKKAAVYMKDVFGEDFYLEIMFHGLDIESRIIYDILKLSKQIGVKLIATNDVHYISPEDAEFHELVMCMSCGRSKNDPNRLRFPYNEFYFKSAQEMYKIFRTIPEAMRNTVEIAEKCDYSDMVFIEDGGEMRLPALVLPPKYATYFDQLEEEAWDGFKRLGYEGSELHSKRLKLELSDLKLAWDTKHYDFSKYLLVVKDIIDESRRQNIDYGIRGSGYGSLTVRCLGISEGVDPLMQDLLWERFLGFDDLYYIGESDFGIGDGDAGSILLGYTVQDGDAVEILRNHPEYAKFSKRIEEEISFLHDTECSDTLFKVFTKKVHGDPKLKGIHNDLNLCVAYLLGLTSKEFNPTQPILLTKRRTYARAGFPDIDMDFDYAKRHLIVEYIKKKWGSDYVANIGTRQTLKTKAALRRAIKVLDPNKTLRYGKDGHAEKGDTNENFQLENTILRTLPTLMKRPDGTAVNSIQEAYKEYPEFRKYMDKYKEVYRVAQKFEGMISAMGSHAAGIVISPVPICKIAPLCITKGAEFGQDQTIATQFAMGELESIGLIKMDILGLSTKTAIVEAMRLIEMNYGPHFAKEIDLSNLPLNDKPTLDLVKSGLTDGCFQLENAGMKEALREIGVDSFDDMVAVIAMYRPGPKEYIPEYAARKKGHHRVLYSHPLMKSITEKTYGILVYQEQVMQAFMTLADLSASEGYLFMKGCAKKKKSIIDSCKEKFIKGALKKGIDKNIVDKIWTDMEKFGGYAFNKSHAVSYAYESYKTAYLKAHFGIEFIAARMTVECSRRNFDEVYKYEQDAIKNWNVKFSDIDINMSKLGYTITGENVLRRPIIVKGVGDKAAEEIVKNQPYKGPDFLYSFGLKVGSEVNTRVVESLWDAGLFRTRSKAKTIADFEIIKKEKKDRKGRPEADWDEW